MSAHSLARVRFAARFSRSVSGRRPYPISEVPRLKVVYLLTKSVFTRLVAMMWFAIAFRMARSVCGEDDAEIGKLERPVLERGQDRHANMRGAQPAIGDARPQDRMHLGHVRARSTKASA